MFPASDSPFRGKFEVLTCTGTGTRLGNYVFVPGSTNLMALMRIPLVSPRDVLAADTISKSLIIDTTTTS